MELNKLRADTEYLYRSLLHHPLQICNRKEPTSNQRAKYMFPKELYCIVGNDTFSSARTFAVTLKDNGLATILGQPTGGKPSSYGMPRKDVLPNTGIRFRVSQALFLRPNAALDDEDALTPDLQPKAPENDRFPELIYLKHVMILYHKY